MTMRSVEEHRDRLLALVAPLGEVSVAVGEALGLVLAEPVTARVDLPGFDNSAMDGYAVRAADLVGATATAPLVLPVDGDIAAGDGRAWRVEAGRCLRIMTGAAMPAGADAVVPVEDSDGGVGRAALTLAPEPGRHVRRRGEDVRSGDVILPAGLVMTPGRIALAAAANAPEVVVHRRPRVAVASTGDELRPVGSALGPGQIVDSNSVMLAALVRAAGAEVVAVDHLPDSFEAVEAYFRRVGALADLVLTTGGVSMGAYDTVKEALLAMGGVEFVKVAMRPGMPQGAGLLPASDAQGEGAAIVTLPGNPVSSLVSFHVFVLPMVRRMSGLGEAPAGLEAEAAVGWRSVAGKTEFTRVVVDQGGLRPSIGQGSHMVGALSTAGALAVVPPEISEVTPGLRLRVIPLLGQEAGHGC